jgi:hypothetical protein
MFIFVIQTLQKKMERNLHETTSRWKTFGKRLFSKDLEVRDEVFSHSLLAIWSSPLLLHSCLSHSSNVTYTYNGLGIISFYKDGVLTGSKMLWSLWPWWDKPSSQAMLKAIEATFEGKLCRCSKCSFFASRIGPGRTDPLIASIGGNVN